MAKDRHKPGGGDRHRPGYMDAYKKETYVQIHIRIRKDSDIIDGLELALKMTGMPKAEYIRNAIEENLRRDGYIE